MPQAVDAATRQLPADYPRHIKKSIHDGIAQRLERVAEHAG
jgi:hypothetical protein